MTGPGESAVARWLREWERRLGADRVRVPDGAAGGSRGSNVGMFRARGLRGVVRPQDVAQVRELVRSAAGAVPPVVLYPVSTGYNWGLGSGEPVVDGAVRLDLSGLDAVRVLDVDAGIAVVEPGVTQGRLAGLLAGGPRMLNVTSSSAHTSVLGNGLDRGVGLRRQRCDDLVGLEVVLADGEVMRVGSWPDEQGRVVPYRHELGPGLVQLFEQSNFGVVTAAVVQLLPRPRSVRGVGMAFPAERLADAVDELRGYLGQRLINGVLKVYPDGPGRWMAYGCVDGDAELTGLVSDVLMRRARAAGPFDEVRELDPADRQSEQLLARWSGDPSRNEAMFHDLFGVPVPDMDSRSDQGWLFFLPLVPMRGAALAEAAALVREVERETETTWRTVMNVLTYDVVDLAVAHRFPRGEKAAWKAHRALDMLHERFDAAGWRPYRLDIDHMHVSAGLNGCPRRRLVVRRLKDLFDPARVLSPGRYEVTGPGSAGAD